MNYSKARRYDKEFKMNAINLYQSGKHGYEKLSKELGIPTSTLANWVLSYTKNGKYAFPGKGNLKPEDAELARLRKELARAREERDILKKALGIFSSLRK
jgi:transposase